MRYLKRSTSLLAACFLLSGVLAGPSALRLGKRLYNQWQGEARWEEVLRNGGPLTPDDPVGRLSIQGIGLHQNIGAYIDEDHLERSASLIGTAILGHRDTHFRRLKDLQTGMNVEWNQVKESASYQVIDTKILTPMALEQIVEDYKERDDFLLLVTCHPFTYIGNAPDRFVAICKKSKIKTKTEAIIPSIPSTNLSSIKGRIDYCLYSSY